MWKSLIQWKELTKQWVDSQFMSINTDFIKLQADNYTRTVQKCTKVLPVNPVLDLLRELVFDFRDTMPVVIALKNKNLKNYHWEQIKSIIGQIFDIHSPSFTL